MGKGKDIIAREALLAEEVELDSYDPFNETGEKVSLYSKKLKALKQIESDYILEGSENKYLSALQKENLAAKKTINEGLPIVYFEDNKLKRDGDEVTISASSGLTDIQFIQEADNVIMKKKVSDVWKEVKRWSGHTP
jgi:hypothetical protein